MYLTHDKLLLWKVATAGIEPASWNLESRDRPIAQAAEFLISD